MITFSALSYFLEVANTRSITQAADKLFISQQALSAQIQRIESNYGIKLFYRGHPLVLTEEGKLLLKHARRIQRELSDFDTELKNIKDFQAGEISISLPMTRGTYMLPPLLASFYRQYPNIHVSLIETISTQEAISILQNGDADFGLSFTPENVQNLSVTQLFEEKFVLLIPKFLITKQIAERIGKYNTNTLPFAIFEELPFVVMKKEYHTGKVFANLCQKSGITPKVVVETINANTMINLCLAGLGATILPLSFFPGLFGVMNELPDNSFCLFKIDCSGMDSSPVSLYYISNRTPSKAGKEFLRIAKEMFYDSLLNDIPKRFQFEP